jgi:RNA polymerase sigma factor (sigma-70 family)
MAEIPKTSVMLLKEISENSDSARWYDFYNRYHPVMDGYLSAAFPSLEADDVIQDAMLVLMRKLPGYRYAPDERGHFRNYLIGIVKFKAIEHLKRRKRDADGLDGYKGDVDALVASEPFVADEEHLKQRQHDAYAIALAQLMSDPEIQERSKCVFDRVTIKNESPEVVANDYGITRNNVDQIKARMIAKLREIISCHGTTEEDLKQWVHDVYEIAFRQLMADPEIQERNKYMFKRVTINNESPELVANAYGVTRSSVDQIKTRMMVKLREIISRLTDI